MRTSYFDPSRFAAKNWLECMDCGQKAGLLDEVGFRCPNCSGLYDVKHPRVAEPTQQLYTDHFWERWRTRSVHRSDFIGLADPGCRSDVWAFEELVMQELPERVSLDERIAFVPAGPHVRSWLGYSPHLMTDEVCFALEGQTPTGSFKDFGMAVLASVAKAAGAPALVCASTGDTSAAAAAYAARAGLGCVVLLPEGKVTPVQLVQPLAYGAKVLLVPGDFDACMAIMQELIACNGAYPANSINPARIEGHQATAFGAWAFYRNELPAWIAAPVGNGSNISAIGKGLRALQDAKFIKRLPRLLGCQAQFAAPLYRSWINHGRRAPDRWRENHTALTPTDTLASAQQIGNPVSAAKVIREIVATNGAMEAASESEIVEALAIAGRDGHFICPQTAVALTGVRHAREAGLIGKDEKVLVVSTATGLKFPNVLDRVAEEAIVRLSQATAAEAATHLQ